MPSVPTVAGPDKAAESNKQIQKRMRVNSFEVAKSSVGAAILDMADVDCLGNDVDWTNLKETGEGSVHEPTG